MLFRSRRGIPMPAHMRVPVFAVWEAVVFVLNAFAFVLIGMQLRPIAWPDSVAVKVRAGIHSGRPTLTDAGYVGLAVHTVARICSAAHGGQILLSGAARDALGRARPAGLRMRKLGAYRFRGLREPLPIVQVESPAMQTRFPPLRTPAAADAELDPKPE